MMGIEDWIPKRDTAGKLIVPFGEPKDEEQRKEAIVEAGKTPIATCSSKWHQSRVAPEKYDAGGWDAMGGIISAARWFHEHHGGRIAFGAVSPASFDALLREPTGPRCASATPGPGVFIQASTGWFHVMADDRLPVGTAMLFDSVTGDELEVANLPTS